MTSTLDTRLQLLLARLMRSRRISSATAALFLLPNREMNVLKRSLSSRNDFTGKEARKIRAEKMVSVLSFPEPTRFPHPESRGKKFLGEIYLNSEWEGGGYGALAPLLVHGFLHLLGYRHEGKNDTIRMKVEEERLMKAYAGRAKQKKRGA